eukprot:13810660-Ditylum_brightwellii.AAC.1
MTGNSNNGDGLNESEQGKATEQEYVCDSGKANGDDDGEEEYEVHSQQGKTISQVDPQTQSSQPQSCLLLDCCTLGPYTTRRHD